MIYYLIIINLITSIFLYKTQRTTLNASITTFTLGSIIAITLSWKAYIILALMLIVESFISSRYNFKTEKRNLNQIINTILPVALLGVLYKLTNKEVYILLYSICISLILGDTISSTVGSTQKNIYDITTLKKLSSPLSGGISLIGTVCGFIASTLILIIYSKLWNHQLNLLIILMPIFGNIIDSLLGSLIQSKYLCNSCNKIVDEKEHCNSKSKLVKGKSFISNSRVNLISEILTIVISYYIFI